MKALLNKSLLFCASLLFSIAAIGQTQLGSTIFGSEKGDYFGTSSAMSKDGKTIVVGSPSSSANGTDAGRVDVYRYENNEWVVLGNEILGNEEFGEAGTSVDIDDDGKTIIIGAPYDANKFGTATVYEYRDGDWVQKGKTIKGTDSYDVLGRSVAISGDGKTIAVGAPSYDDLAIGSLAGQVQIYQYSGGDWSTFGAPIIGELQGEKTGSKIDLSSDGKTIAVAATSNDLKGENAGVVRVYEYSGNWSIIGDGIHGETKSEACGYALSLSDDGKLVAIASPYYGLVTKYTGRVRVYRRSSNAWIQVDDDIIGEANSFSGNSLTLSGDGSTLAVGRPGGVSYSGSVKLFKVTNSNITSFGNGISSDVSGDNTGSSIAFSYNAKRIAVGSKDHTNDNGYNAGAVRVFSLTGGGASLHETQILSTSIYPNPASNSITVQSKFIIENVVITDVVGKDILKTKVNSSYKSLDISLIPSGLYTIHIIGQNKKESKKLIIQH